MVSGYLIIKLTAKLGTAQGTEWLKSTTNSSGIILTSFLDKY